MKKVVITLFQLFIGLSFAALAAAETSEVQALIDVLVQKGVLTRDEAAVVLKETEALVATQKDEMKAKVVKEAELKPLPSWVERLKPKGDLRLRGQYEDRESSNERYRERIRLRFGLDAKLLDTLKFGFGLASGSGDPRSTNQTFEDTFSHKSITLDKAFFDFQPVKSLRVLGGKFSDKAFFYPDDLLWDSDINFEGQALSYASQQKGPAGFFVNSGFFVLDELKSAGNDPFMFYVQPGFELKGESNFSWKMGVAYYAFSHVEGAVLDNSSKTNTLENNVLKYDYDSINPATELAYNWDTKDKDHYTLALIMDYNWNTEPKDDAYLFGVRFGDPKIEKAKDWQAYLNYRRIEPDAFLDTFPDSDFYGGATGVKGLELEMKLGLSKKTSLALDYYRSEKLEGENSSEDLFQVDFNFNF